MKFNIELHGDTTTIYLQKKIPAGWSVSKRALGSWRCRNEINGHEVWLNGKMGLKCMLDTYYHEIGHVMDNILEAYAMSDGPNNRVGWRSQLAGCSWVHTFREVEKGAELIRTYKS